MARRQYRSRSFPLGNVAYIGAKLTWCAAVGRGDVRSLLLRAAGLLSAKLAERSTSTLFPMLEAVFGRRMHWRQWFGIACGLVGTYFDARICLLASGQEKRARASRVLGKTSGPLRRLTFP